MCSALKKKQQLCINTPDPRSLTWNPNLCPWNRRYSLRKLPFSGSMSIFVGNSKFQGSSAQEKHIDSFNLRTSELESPCRSLTHYRVIRVILELLMRCSGFRIDHAWDGIINIRILHIYNINQYYILYIILICCMHSRATNKQS